MISLCGPIAGCNFRASSVRAAPILSPPAQSFLTPFQSLSEPLPLFTSSRQEGRASTSASNSYAATLIATLRAERDAERIAHAETRRQANMQVSLLRAQLATREAELERTSVPCSDPNAHTIPLGLTPMRRPGLSSRDVDHVLEVANQRNTALEAEIKYLAKHLDELNTSSEDATSASPASKNLADPPKEQRASAAYQQRGMIITQPSSSIADVDGDGGDTGRKSSDEQNDNQPLTMLQEFEAEIADFGNQVSALQDENNLIAHMVRPNQQLLPLAETSYIEGNHRQPVSTQEPELQRTVESMPFEPPDARQATERIPAQWMEDTPLSDDIQVQHLLDDSDGEISMDLATPLNPTSILPSSRSRSPSRSPNHSTESPHIVLPSIPPTPPSSSFPASPLLPRELVAPSSHMSPLGMEIFLHSETEWNGTQSAPESSRPRRQLEISHEAFQELQDMVVELLDSPHSETQP
ncbi:hypothetical protein HGRIS_004149 [Hohenbuehelia grisea]|uniref:Uncharacterized protein n=1 Tax=Hohenbuehelia grisea TaxID=104357 RepID=A0ABR3JHU8_9AGAR